MMNTNRGLSTRTEAEDLARYKFATGSLALRQLVDLATCVFWEGRPLSEVELRRLHDELRSVWYIIVGETIRSFGPDEISELCDVPPDYYSHYSDGTKVISYCVGPDREQIIETVPLHFRERDLVRRE